jgi:hypothetical protein
MLADHRLPPERVATEDGPAGSRGERTEREPRPGCTRGGAAARAGLRCGRATNNTRNLARIPERARMRDGREARLNPGGRPGLRG